jgi:hypothetical protein
MQLKSALSFGGFRLLKWSSNVPELFDKLDVEERAETTFNLDLQPSPIKRMLGVQWDMKEDIFTVQVDYTHSVPTKRKILSCIASVYDPIGFTSPALLPARLLMQDLCKANLSWDDTVSGEHARRWSQWIRSLSSMSTLRIPRCLNLENATNGRI